PVPVPADGLDTVHRQCDFCGDPQPVWAITGKNLTVLTLGGRGDLVQGLGEVWAACAACTVDIEAGRPHPLGGPAGRAPRRRLGAGRDAVRAASSALHAEFLAHRVPGRTLITTTAWPDLHRVARDLPRVRDGLARFLRGPLGLPEGTAVPARRHLLADSLDR